LGVVQVQEFDALIDTIRAIKVLHADYSEKYKASKAAAIELARSIYGFVTTYRYEDVPISPNSFSKLLLAAIIAERYLLKKYKNLFKHVTISIIGLGGSGKTTYSIVSAYGALRLLGLPDDVAINTVSALTFFSPKEFVDFVHVLIEERKWVPFIILDDIGSQISKYWIFLGQHFWSHLFSILDQVKDWTGVIVMTARSFNSIPARLRELTDLVVEAKEVDLSGAVLDIFMYYSYDDYVSLRRRRVGLKYIDILLPTVKMPDELWSKMIETRRATGLERIKIVKEALEVQPLIELRRIAKLKKLKGENAEKGVEGVATDGGENSTGS